MVEVLPPEWYQWNYRPKEIKWPSWFKEWPGGARVAVQFHLMHEWQTTPRGGGPPVGRPMPVGSHYREDFLQLSAQEYGFKFGLWRFMDMLDRQGIKATVMMSGISAEFWPEGVKELNRRGHEIATHHWDQAVHPPVFKSKEEELESLRKSMVAIEKVTGERPYGYMSPGPRPTPLTLEIVADEGFVWDGDYYDADIPYILNIKGRKLVSLCYVRPGFTDNEVWGSGPTVALDILKNEFDAVYRESALHPMRFAYATHLHFTSPGRVKVLEEFIQYVKGHPGVWFARGIDIAKFWLQHEK